MRKTTKIPFPHAMEGNFRFIGVDYFCRRSSARQYTPISFETVYAARVAAVMFFGTLQSPIW